MLGLSGSVIYVLCKFIPDLYMRTKHNVLVFVDRFLIVCRWLTESVNKHRMLNLVSCYNVYYTLAPSSWYFLGAEMKEKK